jgi:hypothetical protein
MGASARIRWAWKLALGLVIVWLGVVAVMLVVASRHSDGGLDELRAARADRSFSTLVDPATGRRLRSAAGEFDAAEALFGSPLVAPLKVVPVVGRQVRGAEKLNQGAASTAHIAAEAAGELREAATGPTPRGRERVALLRDMADLVVRSERRLRAVGPGPSTALIGPLDRAADEYGIRRREALEGLDAAGTLLDGAARFLAGPRRYLVLGANNAEMRAGSGMFLSAGPLDAVDGRLDLGEVGPTNELVLPEGVPVDDADLARNWSWLDPGADFRNLALTPRFPVSAAIARQMWRQVPGGGEVDGVLAMDVDAVRHLLRALGPVTVDGVQYTTRSVRYQLLNGQYGRFDRQDVRRDRLGRVAEAVFDQLESGTWELADLADALISAARGRHLMAWSADAVEQRTWEVAGIDGELSDRSLAVSVLNRGGNKLDYFLEEEVAVSKVQRDGRTHVTVRVVLRNTTPDDQPTFVAGPNIESLVAGEYAGIVVVNLPRRAAGLAARGGEYATFTGRDGPTRALGRYVRIRAGETETVTVTFSVPDGIPTLEIEPGARIPPARWGPGEEARMDRRRTFEL